MQDLRVLVAERSIMTIHIRGEYIEIPHHSIGFLLEGFVKTQGAQEELIISPPALLPSLGDQSFQGSETSGNCNLFSIPLDGRVVFHLLLMYCFP